MFGFKYKFSAQDSHLEIQGKENPLEIYSRLNNQICVPRMQIHSIHWDTITAVILPSFVMENSALHLDTGNTIQLKST